MNQHRRTLVFATVVAVVALGCHEVHLDFEVHGETIRIFDDLYSVSMVDDQHAVAVGYYGAAYWSEDGGQSWQRGQTGTRISLYNVAMADATHGWAVGQRGLILRTTDGGRTWQSQDNLKAKEGTHLFSVTAIDRDTAWVVGEWGTRVRTRDGGLTWEDRSFTITEFHSQFVWLTAEEQDRVRRGEKVYDDVSVNDIYCQLLPGTHCWLIGEFGYIFYSNDHGESWQKSSIEGSVEMKPIPVAYNVLEVDDESAAKLAVFADQVKSEGHLNIAVEGLANADEIRDFGSEEDPSELFEMLEARAQDVRGVLEEAGVPSDRLRYRGQPPWDYEDYLEDDPDFLKRYLAGRLNDTPGIKVSVIQNPILFTIRFRDAQNGLISGLGGVILRSEDGGQSWLYKTIERKLGLYSVNSIPGRALAVGEKGLSRVSVDGGSTWTDPEEGDFPTIFTFMRDVGFAPSGRTGLIVGQGGRILRSTDAGHVWQTVLPPAAS